MNGERIGTTSRGDNTFRIDEDDRDWNDRLTISKDGYDTETIYLDDYYGHYRLTPAIPAEAASTTGEHKAA